MNRSQVADASLTIDTLKSVYITLFFFDVARTVTVPLCAFFKTLRVPSAAIAIPVGLPTCSPFLLVNPTTDHSISLSVVFAIGL